jgi:hypothetical protein
VSKYGNKPTEAGGHTFHSRKEAAHYEELLLRVKAGEIERLALQPKFPIVVNGVKVCDYIGDFSFWDVAEQRVVTQDVKSEATRRIPLYRLKKKLVKAVYGVDIEEV